MPSNVNLTREGPLTHVQLARVEKLNAFDADLVAEVHHAVRAAAGDGTRLMVFSGAGKGFSGGFDLDGLDHGGSQELIEAICIGPDDDMEERRQEIAEAVEKVADGEGVIVLTDLFGGTPSNLSISLMRPEKVEGLTV